MFLRLGFCLVGGCLILEFTPAGDRYLCEEYQNEDSSAVKLSREEISQKSRNYTFIASFIHSKLLQSDRRAINLLSF